MRSSSTAAAAFARAVRSATVLAAVIAAGTAAVTATGCRDAPAPAAPAPPAAPPADAPVPLAPQLPRDVSATPAFEHLARGEGPQVRDGDIVVLHYTMSVAKSGREIATSRRTDEPFPLEVGAGHNIPGWERVVAKLRVGDRVRTTIPSDLAYGDAGVEGVVPEKADLVMEIEVLEIAAPPTWEVLKSGEGAQLKPGMQAVVHYVASLPDGTVIDDSRDRGEAYAFVVCGGSAVEVFDRVAPHMRVGDRWKVTSHWAFAYGAAGRPPAVPPRTGLVYDLEVLSATIPK